MGRLVGFLADCLALVRLAVDARSLWREWRGDGPAPGSDRPAVGQGADQAVPPDVGDPGSAGGAPGRPAVGSG